MGGQQSPSVIQRIGNYALDVHFHHIRIPVILTKVAEKIRSNVKNLYQQPLMYYQDNQRHQAHLAATLIRDSSGYILNASLVQLSAIQNNLLSIMSTLPASNSRPEHQCERLFGLGATLFSLYNYSNQRADDTQIIKNRNFITSLTHIAEIQKEHLKHLDILMWPSTDTCIFNN
jgi:hypothetical protein